MARTKRIAAPKLWKIERKSSKYTVSISAGPHKKEHALPISILIRDYIKIAENMKETRQILNNKMVKVNGRAIKDHRFPVGLMDVVSIKDVFFRMIAGRNGITPKEITKDTHIILYKILNKTSVKGGKTQINMSGGENMILEKDDKKYTTGNVIVYDIEKKKIKEILTLDKGTLVLITGGKNMGELGVVESIEIIKNPLPTLVTLKLGDKMVKVPKDYVFAVGTESPVIEVR